MKEVISEHMHNAQLWIRGYLFIMFKLNPAVLSHFSAKVCFCCINSRNRSRILSCEPYESWAVRPKRNRAWCGENKSPIGVLYFVFQENWYLKKKKSFIFNIIFKYMAFLPLHKHDQFFWTLNLHIGFLSILVLYIYQNREKTYSYMHILKEDEECLSN